MDSRSYNRALAADGHRLDEAISSRDMKPVKGAVRSLLSHANSQDVEIILQKVLEGVGDVFMECVPSLEWIKDIVSLPPEPALVRIRAWIRDTYVSPYLFFEAGTDEATEYCLGIEKGGRGHYYQCLATLVCGLVQGIQARHTAWSKGVLPPEGPQAALAILDAVYSLPAEFRSPEEYALSWAHRKWCSYGSQGPPPRKATIIRRDEDFDYVERALESLLLWLRERRGPG